MKSVAIVGLSCRFPGANSKDDFWNLLLGRIDAITPLQKDRIAKSQLLTNMKPELAANFFGGFVKNPEMFDPKFFHISPREAPFLDPQQRLLLECTWEAIEDSGILPSELSGSPTGVYIGSSTNDYGARFQSNPKLVTVYAGTGNTSCINANRISYQLNLTGPSLTLDTACSSSLLAVHLACEALQSGEVEMAIAGGSNLIFSPTGQSVFAQANSLAADGRCKAFDSRADGFVRSEGVGVILLMPEELALAKNIPIYAVIKGSAVNQDGKTNGLMAPNRWSQERVIELALEDAGRQAADVCYVETHGTGTLLGDPIEANALGATIGQKRSKKHPLRIGSLKTNIGHMEAAAGIGSIIKMALSIKHGIVPASLHFENPNPYIPFDELNIKFQSETSNWSEINDDSALVGISAFGFGGTNVHVIIGRPLKSSRGQTELTRKKLPPYLFAISAVTPRALVEYATAYINLLNINQKSPRFSLFDLCANVATKKTHFRHRLAFSCTSLEELLACLKNFCKSGPSSPVEQSLVSQSGPVWIFSGQGSQWQGMSRQLFEENPVFRRQMEECDKEIRKQRNWSLLEELQNPHSDYEKHIDKIQPVLFSISISLAEVARSWGVKPRAVVGHSMGEVAAAWVAGILSLPDAVKVICTRSSLMSTIEGDGMMAVVELNFADASQALSEYGSDISIAATNSPRSTVLSGTSESIKSIVKDFEVKNIFSRLIKVQVASHSSQVDPILDSIQKELASIEPQAGHLPFLSTVHLESIRGEELDGNYWRMNLRNPVQFSEAVTILIEQGARAFVEMSPHPILLHSIQETAESVAKGDILTLPSMRRNESESEIFTRSAATLFMAGQNFDFKKIFDDQFYPIDLPSYPWQKEAFWIEDELSYPLDVNLKGLEAREIKGADFKTRRVFQLKIDMSDKKYLIDHKVQGLTVFPGTAYLEIVMNACRQAFPDRQFSVSDMAIEKALFLSPEEEQIIQIIFSAISQTGFVFKIYSSAVNIETTRDANLFWKTHANGKIIFEASTMITEFSRSAQITDKKIFLQNKANSISGVALYELLNKFGNDYGATFRGIQNLWTEGTEALGEIRVHPTVLSERDNYIIHPALLDASMHSLMGLVYLSQNRNPQAFWPTLVRHVRLIDSKQVPKWSYARIISQSKTTYVGDVFVCNEFGETLVIFEGVELSAVETKTSANFQFPRRKSDWVYDLKWQALATEAADSVLIESPRQWLIISSRNELAEEIEQGLINRGLQVSFMTSQIETDFSKLLENTFSKLAPVGVLYLQALDLEDVPYGHNAEIDSSYEKLIGITSQLVKMFKTIEQNNWQTNVGIWFVTSGAFNVTENNEKLNPFQAPLWGFGRSLLQEQPNLMRGLVDIEPSIPAAESADFLLNCILKYSGECQFAIRNSKLFIPRLSRRLAASTSIPPVLLRSDSSYLLTGGLGNLGALVAEWLIAKGARRLIILGRSPIPERREWRRLSNGSKEFMLVEKIKHLERLGSSVRYLQIDVSDDVALKKLITEIELNQDPRVAGVIHAAGTVFSSAFGDMTDQQTKNVFDSKIIGTLNLSRLFDQKRPLDFFITFSSFSSWLSSPYLSIYAGANLFMDALIQDRRNNSLTGLSVNWATWDGEASSGSGERGTYRGVGTLPRSEGLLILEDFISENIVQAGVGVINWQTIKNNYEALSVSSILKSLMDETKSDLPITNVDSGSAVIKVSSSALKKLNVTERIALLQPYLVSLVAKAVKRLPSDTPIEQSLNTFGLDSLIALEIKNKIARDTSVVLPVVFFLKGPNIIEVTQLIAEKIDDSKTPLTDAVSDTAAELDISQMSEEDLDKILAIIQPQDDQTKKTG